MMEVLWMLKQWQQISNGFHRTYPPVAFACARGGGSYSCQPDDGSSAPKQAFCPISGDFDRHGFEHGKSPSIGRTPS